MKSFHLYWFSAVFKSCLYCYGGTNNLLVLFHLSFHSSTSFLRHFPWFNYFVFIIIYLLLYCGSYFLSFLHSFPPLPSFPHSFLAFQLSSFLPSFPVSLHPSFVYFSFLSFIPPFFPSFRCGHCKKLAPEFEKAASRLKGSVQLAKVMCPSCSLLLWTPVSQQSYLFVSHLCGRWTVPQTLRRAVVLGSQVIPPWEFLGMAKIPPPMMVLALQVGNTDEPSQSCSVTWLCDVTSVCVCVCVFRGDLRDHEEADWSRLDAPEDQRRSEGLCQ